MISSASSTDRTTRPELPASTAPAAPRPSTPRADLISTESAAYLRGALARQPAVRPEVVERARALAADPAYPSAAVIADIARQIAAAPDLSEDPA